MNSSKVTNVVVTRPTKNAYTNFVKWFYQRYTGPKVENKEMMRMAAAEWKVLSDLEKQPFVNLAANERNKSSPVVLRREQPARKAKARHTVVTKTKRASPYTRTTRR